jgi:uncharacterized protein (DUF697 family)
MPARKARKQRSTSPADVGTTADGIPTVPAPEEITMSNAPVDEVQTPDPTPEPTPEPEPAAAAPSVAGRELLAHEVVKKHVAYAAVVGLVPLPVVNAAGVAGIEIKLLYDLAKLYDVPFRQDRVKSIVSSLIGGVLSTELGIGTAGLVKGWAVVGGALAFIAVPTFASAVTYAVGRVFIQHFESGGTFLNFDPEKVKAHFKAQFRQAKTATA